MSLTTRPVPIEGLVITIVCLAIVALPIGRLLTGKWLWRETGCYCWGAVFAWILWRKS